ncbi:MAG: carboxypeptidase-like regulatory domain-containing protein, partial [Bacteroidota bacterium]
MLALFSWQANAQDRTLSGKVTSSDDNSTVPSVSVVVVGTTIGTSTDMGGNFKLTVPANAKTLRLSGVGMKSKEVALGASNNVDVTIVPDVLKLE